MGWLIAGLVLFLGIHVFSSLRPARERVIARLGEGAYKGLYSLVSVAGFGLIVAGMSKAPSIELWNSPACCCSAASAFIPSTQCGRKTAAARGPRRHDGLSGGISAPSSSDWSPMHCC